MNIRFRLTAVPVLFLAHTAVVVAVPPQVPPPIARKVDRPVPPGEPDDSVLRQVALEVNFDAARSSRERLRLPLFQGTQALELVRTKRETTRDGSVIWSGRVAGQPASIVVFSASRKVLFANIATQPTREKDAEFYQIRFLGGGLHVLRQIDPSRLPPEGRPINPEFLEGESPRTCSTDPASRIDVLVLFTKEAARKASGPEAMQEAIKGYVRETNESYERSGIMQQLRLVGTKEVDYDESGSLPGDLQALKLQGGALDIAHGLRNDTGADLVALIVEYTKTRTDSIGCGQAFVMKKESKSFESSAFAVVPRVCADGKYSFAHELGHLMGARHDRTADDEEDPFPFSHGFVHKTPRPAFRTIMATDMDCDRGCKRVPYWSNPEVHYPDAGGVAMGVAGDDEPADNRQTLNETADTVANFRCAAGN